MMYQSSILKNQPMRWLISKWCTSLSLSQDCFIPRWCTSPVFWTTNQWGGLYQNDVPVYHYHKIDLFIDDVPVQYSEQPTYESMWLISKWLTSPSLSQDCFIHRWCTSPVFWTTNQWGGLYQNDVPVYHYHKIVLFLDDVPVQYSKQPTNEVAYIKMMSFLDEVPEEMKLYVPLFTNVITK